MISMFASQIPIPLLVKSLYLMVALTISIVKTHSPFVFDV